MADTGRSREVGARAASRGGRFVLSRCGPFRRSAVLTRRLAAAARAHGASFQRAHVERLEPKVSGASALICSDLEIDAHRSFSPPAPGRARLPTKSARMSRSIRSAATIIEFAMDVCPITRPVSPVDLGFYITPMAGRLRVAGTVELGGLCAPLNPRRTALLERGVRKLFPDLGAPTARWLGFRPSLPDSLPVIGPSRRHPGLIHAFGHGHLGMTLAAVTSRVVASLIEKRNDVPDLCAFRPDRFG